MFSLVYHLVAWKILLIGIPFSVVALAGSVPYVASTRLEVRPSWVSQSFFETRIWYDLWIQVCPRWHVETLDTAKGLASEVDYVPFQMRTNPQFRKTRKIKDYIIPPRLLNSFVRHLCLWNSACVKPETAVQLKLNAHFTMRPDEHKKKHRAEYKKKHGICNKKTASKERNDTDKEGTNAETQTREFVVENEEVNI